jgi:hypothetical protein
MWVVRPRPGEVNEWGVSMRFYFVRSLVPMGVHSDADVSLLPPAPNSPNSSDLTRSPRVSQTSRKVCFALHVKVAVMTSLIHIHPAVCEGDLTE